MLFLNARTRKSQSIHGMVDCSQGDRTTAPRTTVQLSELLLLPKHTGAEKKERARERAREGMLIEMKQEGSEKQS